MQQLALIIGLLLATVVMALPGASMSFCIRALRFSQCATKPAASAAIRCGAP